MEKKGTVILKRQLKNDCIFYDPLLSGCYVTDCFKCINADYRITLHDGTIIRDFKYYGVRGKGIEVQKYLIEFFDKVDLENIDSYLINSDSDYRITRLNDNFIVHKSKKDIEQLKQQEAEKDKQYEEEMKNLFGEENYNLIQERKNNLTEQKQTICEKEGKSWDEIVEEACEQARNLIANKESGKVKKKSRFEQFISKITGK